MDGGNNMEARKVQRTGTSTMTVSLPKDWVDNNGIKPGDQVSMEVQQDGTLTIGSASRRKKGAMKATITLDENAQSDHVTRKLIGAYLTGCSIIEVRAKARMDIETKRAVKDFARLVIGPEIIEETATTVVLHDLSDPLELPQKKCVRRMHLIVDSMHRDAMTAYVEGDEALARGRAGPRSRTLTGLYWMTVKQHALILEDRLPRRRSWEWTSMNRSACCWRRGSWRGLEITPRRSPTTPSPPPERRRVKR